MIDLIDKKHVDVLAILDDQCIKQSQKMSIDSLDDVLDTISPPTNSSLDSLDRTRSILYFVSQIKFIGKFMPSKKLRRILLALYLKRMMSQKGINLLTLRFVI